MLRIGAIAIAVLPPLLGVVLGASIGVWLGPGLAIVGGVAFTLTRPRVRALVLLGTMLAVLAGLAAGLAASPRPTSMWLPGVLVVLMTTGSLVCLWIAAQGREQPSAGDPRRRRSGKDAAPLLLLLLLPLGMATLGCGHRHPRRDADVATFLSAPILDEDATWEFLRRFVRSAWPSATWDASASPTLDSTSTCSATS